MVKLSGHAVTLSPEEAREMRGYAQRYGVSEQTAVASMFGAEIRKLRIEAIPLHQTLSAPFQAEAFVIAYGGDRVAAARALLGSADKVYGRHDGTLTMPGRGALLEAICFVMGLGPEDF